MYLRKLELRDAPFMIEWMHDDNITHNLRTNFSRKTIQDVEKFIRLSENSIHNINLAIVSDVDEYMGTVSLKNIENNSAEFAIAVRKKAMGHGYSWFGMRSMIDKAFNELHLDCIYWCVSKKNERAVRFYDKHNFGEVLDVPCGILNRYTDVENLKWYSVLRGTDYNIRDSVAGCKVLHIKTIPTVNAGELSFFEYMRDISFDVKRIYYISKVPEGVRRGFHAHKELKQILFCPYGRIQLTLENEEGREEIELSDPSIGVIIDKTTWREMLWIQKDSVLCVAASDYYDANDYIRSYEEYKRYIGGLR